MVLDAGFLRVCASHLYLSDMVKEKDEHHGVGRREVRRDLGLPCLFVACSVIMIFLSEYGIVMRKQQDFLG